MLVVNQILLREYMYKVICREIKQNTQNHLRVRRRRRESQQVSSKQVETDGIYGEFFLM